MRKNRLVLLPIIASVFLFCSEHQVQLLDTELANGRVVGSVHGVITDFCSHTLFDSAEVTISWIVSGTRHTTLTNDLGYYSIIDLPSGEYVITFSSAEDYAVSRITVTIPELEDIIDEELPATNRDYQHSVTENVYLYKLNAGIHGHVYKRESDASITPAVGVTVAVDYTWLGDEYQDYYYNVFPGKYTTTTNTAGYYSFDALPGTPTAILETMPYSNESNEWGLTYQTITLAQNSDKPMEDIVLTIVSPVPMIVQNNFIDVDDFSVSSDLLVTFSKYMDTTSFAIELYHMTDDMYADWERVECTIKWTSLLSVTVNPCVSLLAGTQHRLVLAGRSQDDHDFANEYEFWTQPGIEFVSTNLEREDGVFNQFPVSSAIRILYSMSVNLAVPETEITLKDQASLDVVFNTSLTADGKTLIITPVNALEPGQQYHLYYKIYSYLSEDYDSDNIYFQTLSNETVPSKVSGLTLYYGDWEADWSTTSIQLRWNTQQNVEQYHVYAKDSYRNSDLVHIAEPWCLDYTTWQSAEVTLPVQFDYYEDDGRQTPFLNETQVTLYVTAANEAGEGPLSDPIVLSDGTPATISFGTQYTSADNSAGESSVSFEIYLNNSTTEYLKSVSCSFTESGGDGLYVLPNTAYSFAWNSAHNNKYWGIVTITVPAGKNGAGDTLVLECYDTSGNRSTTSRILW